MIEIRANPLDSPQVNQNGSTTLVDSLLHPQAVLIRQVLTRVNDQVCGRLILIDDEENIVEAIRVGVSIQSIFYAGNDGISEFLRQQVAPTVSIYEVARRTCKKLFENDKLSRIFAIATAPLPWSLESLLQRPGDIVVLDDVSISGNIGAIIRTSLAMGASGIVLLNSETIDLYDRRLIRASRGHLFAMPVVTTTTNEFVRFCAKNALPLLVTIPRAPTQVQEIVSFPQRLAIVFGSEKVGCSQPLLDAASIRIQIPTCPDVESLNVSAAAAITLYCRYGANVVWRHGYKIQDRDWRLRD